MIPNTDRDGPFLPEPAAVLLQCWKLVLAYDGTDYKGWQVQPGLRTVQGELARALHAVTGESLLPQGSGRTDAGVHAQGQAVSLGLRAAIPPERLLRALNRKLPSSIRVMQAEHAAPGFHARGDVVSKTYEYRVFLRRLAGSAQERVCPPAVARFTWDCRWPLDLEAMKRAAEGVVGKHDFTSFAAHDPDRTSRSITVEEPNAGPHNVRTIFRSQWAAEDELLRYHVTGSGFLHHMVRNLVGTFIEVGAGRLGPSAIATILERRDRRAAGMTAPPQGLCLMEVQYGSSQQTFTAVPETDQLEQVSTVAL